MSDNKELVMDVHILLAIFKCFSEQLHSLNDKHNYSLKQKFERMKKVVRQYEKEIDKSMIEANDESIENIYDAFMDSILEAREVALKSINN